ncbi:MAG: zinc ribbon domain-containing protein [Clostridia bacterium]|nr:zinc ribbon domain-containing protein [Clostridia bacterium]
MVECEECGKKLSICVHKHKRDNGTTAYLRCNTYASNTNKGFCTPHSNSLNAVTDLVIKMVRERCKSFLQEEDYNKSAIQLQRRINTRKNMIKNEISSLNKQLADVNKKIDKIYEDKISETLREEDFKRLYANFSERRTAIEKMIVELEKTSEEEEKIIDITKIVKQFMKMKDVSRPMLVSLVDKVVINEQKEITIYYKFKILNLQALKTNEEFVEEKIG